MLKKLIILSFAILLFSFESLAQSVSKNAENMFIEGGKEKAEEIVEGIKDTQNETDNAVERTVEELKDDIEGIEEATEDAPEIVKEEEKTEISDNPMENTLILSLKSGQVIIRLKPEVAPNHVARIKELVREGFYDGVVFHRVIDGFMAQTGDPTGTGRGGSGKKLEAEFSDEKHIRGTVSMARAADPNSADSQFFIMFDEAPHLDNNYTVFGQVIEGMELIDQIKKGFGPNGMVSDPDSIVTLKVAADLDEENLPASLKKSEEKPEGEEPKEENTETEAPEAVEN